MKILHVYKVSSKWNRLNALMIELINYIVTSTEFKNHTYIENNTKLVVIMEIQSKGTVEIIG